MNNNTLICIIMMFGILAPTSVGGGIQPLFGVFIALIIFPNLCYILLKQKKVDVVNLFIALSFGLLITFFTFTSDYDTYRYGNGLMFINLFLLSLINNDKNTDNLNIYVRTLMLVNLFIFFLAICVMFNIPPGGDIISNYYQAFYIELIPNMLMQNKPVAVFGTHSLAGFYNFILFLANLAVYKYTKQTRFLLISIAYMVFLFWLQSATSLVYLLIAIILLQMELYKAQRFLFIVLLVIQLLSIVLLFQMADDLIEATMNQLFSDRNGLGGRYSEGGNLINNLNYILAHPFRGIGFAYSTDFFYADSGYLEYALRNSILGAIGVFIAFSRFILRNVKTSHRYLLLAAYLSFEVGFSNLLYFRTFAITLFVVALYNQLQRQPNKTITNPQTREFS